MRNRREWGPRAAQQGCPPATAFESSEAAMPRVLLHCLSIQDLASPSKLVLANMGYNTPESTGTGVKEMGSTSAASLQMTAASSHAASSRGRNLQAKREAGCWK